MHTPNISNPRKLNPTQNTPNTAHCRQSGKQTAQKAEKVVEHTVPDKNRSGALNAMRSTRRETKNTGKRASNARRNGDVTNGKSSEQRATERKRDVRESEQKTRNATNVDVGKERARNEVGKSYVSGPQQKLKQTT